MSREYVCKYCGHIGIPDGAKSRNGFLSAIIFLLFMLPVGLFRKKGRCSKCGGTSLASLNSKYGKKAMEEFYMKEFTNNLPPKKPSTNSGYY